MADFMFNIALGRFVQWFQNVEDNSPAAAVIRVFVSDANGDTDDAMDNANDIGALYTGTANEVTNTNYANASFEAADITITINDTTNLVDIDITDVTFSAIASGDAWTDVVVAYDADGSDTDSTTLPMHNHDFVVTPDGSDITMQVAAAGISRAT